MIEEGLSTIIPVISSIFELIGVLIIVLAGIKGFYLLLKSNFDFDNKEINTELGKAMSLSLSFLLAAEILLTILVRNIEGLIILVGIAALRVGLYFMLQMDLKNSVDEDKNSELSK